MKSFFIFICCLLFVEPSLAVVRFKASQLSFKLFDSTGREVACSHAPLQNNSPASPPPWWSISCGARSYTVDVWMDLWKGPQGAKLELMYHIKEGVSSSGEKLVRFDNQHTVLIFPKAQLPQIVRSSLDVRNGLADLVVEINLEEK